MEHFAKLVNKYTLREWGETVAKNKLEGFPKSCRCLVNIHEISYMVSQRAENQVRDKNFQNQNVYHILEFQTSPFCAHFMYLSTSCDYPDYKRE